MKKILARLILFCIILSTLGCSSHNHYTRELNGHWIGYDLPKDWEAERLQVSRSPGDPGEVMVKHLKTLQASLGEGETSAPKELLTPLIADLDTLRQYGADKTLVDQLSEEIQSVLKSAKTWKAEALQTRLASWETSLQELRGDQARKRAWLVRSAHPKFQALTIDSKELQVRKLKGFKVNLDGLQLALLEQKDDWLVIKFQGSDAEFRTVLETLALGPNEADVAAPTKRNYPSPALFLLALYLLAMGGPSGLAAYLAYPDAEPEGFGAVAQEKVHRAARIGSYGLLSLVILSLLVGTVSEIVNASKGPGDLVGVLIFGLIFGLVFHFAGVGAAHGGCWAAKLSFEAGRGTCALAAAMGAVVGGVVLSVWEPIRALASVPTEEERKRREERRRSGMM